MAVALALALAVALALLGAGGAAGGAGRGAARKHAGQSWKEREKVAFREKEAKDRDKARARQVGSDEPVARGRPGEWNEGVVHSREGILTDKATNMQYDLSTLIDLHREHQRFFEFKGVKGGPRDVPHMYYDYFVGFAGVSDSSMQSLLPHQCSGVSQDPPIAAFQVTAPRKGQGAGAQAEAEDDQEDSACLALGSSEGWEFRMIDELTAEAGLQIRYSQGQECLKRVVTHQPRNSNGKGTRKRMVTSWVPAPRNFTITLECGASRQIGEKHDPEPGEMDALVYPLDSIEAQEFMQRDVDATTGATVMETEMCNYELRWKTPYGCPVSVPLSYDKWRKSERRKLANERFGSSTNQQTVDPPKSAPTPRSRESRRSSGGGGGESRSWAGYFLACVWKSILWGTLCVLAAAGVQMYRKRSRMRLILPQLFEKNRRHRAVATKRFLSVMMEKDGRPSGRIV